MNFRSDIVSIEKLKLEAQLVSREINICIKDGGYNSSYLKYEIDYLKDILNRIREEEEKNI